MAKDNKAGLFALGAVGALAGAAAALFMRKKENRQKVEKALGTIEKRGGEMVKMAEKEMAKMQKGIKSTSKKSKKSKKR